MHQSKEYPSTRCKDQLSSFMRTFKRSKLLKRKRKKIQNQSRKSSQERRNKILISLIYMTFQVSTNKRIMILEITNKKRNYQLTTLGFQPSFSRRMIMSVQTVKKENLTKVQAQTLTDISKMRLATDQNQSLLV